MTHDNVTDIEKRLLAWEPLISAGYEVPAAGQAMHEAADTIATLRKQLEDARDEALEEAANVADDHAFNAWHIADAEGQNSACASGRNYGGRAIAKYIRALKGKP